LNRSKKSFLWGGGEKSLDEHWIASIGAQGVKGKVQRSSSEGGSLQRARKRFTNESSNEGAR